MWTLAVGVAASTGRALLVPAALRESRFQLLGVEELAALVRRMSELRQLAEHRSGGRLAYTVNLGAVRALRALRLAFNPGVRLGLGPWPRP